MLPPTEAGQTQHEAATPPTLEGEVTRLKDRFMKAFGFQDGNCEDAEGNDGTIINYYGPGFDDDDWRLEIPRDDNLTLLGRNPLRPHKFFAEIRRGTYEQTLYRFDAVREIDKLFDEILPKPPVQSPTS